MTRARWGESVRTREYLWLPFPFLSRYSSLTSLTSFLWFLILCLFLSLFLLLKPFSTLHLGPQALDAPPPFQPPLWVPHFLLFPQRLLCPSLPQHLSPEHREPSLPRLLLPSVRLPSFLLIFHFPSPIPGVPSSRGGCGEIFWLEVNLLPMALLELGLFLEITPFVPLAPVGIPLHRLVNADPAVPGMDPLRHEGQGLDSASPFQPLAVCMDP